jgi:hypothetical protein
MRSPFKKTIIVTGLLSAGFFMPISTVQAEAVDFSCMEHEVRGKIQVSEHLKEYDIVVRNQCPGTVYWSMCIEKMNPWTNETQAALMPSGVIQMEQKSRVNLQLKKHFDASRSRQSFGEFYLNVGYALKPTSTARCIAGGCESKRRRLRTEFRANDTAWQKAKKVLTTRMSTECPQSGWDTEAQDECKAEIRKRNNASMERFEQRDEELRSSMSAIEPDLCRVYGGG